MSTSAKEHSSGVIDSPPTPAAEASGSDAGRDIDDALDFLSPHQKAAPNSLPSVNRLRPKGSFTSYHKPLRSETPTSSTSTPGISQREQAVRSTTPSDTGSDTGVIGIGMALGSPTHPPDYAITPWQPFLPTMTTTVESLSSFKDDPSKSKSRKWGIFTRTRSKRSKIPDARLRDDPTSSRSASPVQQPPKQLDNVAQDGRDAAFSPRRKPLAKSRTDPTMGERTSSPRAVLTRRGTSSPLARDAGDKTGQRHKDTRDFRSPSPGSPYSDQLLDISIPDVTMERYSIMFGHLIENRSTTSLLARRRDRLKSIQEDEGLAQQSASSGPSPGTPALESNVSPKQLASPESAPGPRLSPRQRSSTFPAALSAPPQTSLKTKGESQEQFGTPLHVAASTRLGGGKEKAAATTSLPAERPRLISKFHQRSSSDQGLAPTPSPLAVDTRLQVSTRSPSVAADTRLQVSTRSPSVESKISPRTWNTAHPPLSPPQAAPSPPPAVRPLPASSARSGTPSDQEPDMAPAQDPVEVSIARQISVSRQQQALLGPLQKQLPQSKCVNETKSSRPRFIDPWQDPKASPALHRMSERVVVEGR
ncbi:hypothetical protein HRG_003605 [Hirsutella rhossiliensis]|uniref:Uncharacterized protein n=1 Tax=Hirsutella rhossiliensis TaxID=111463 RepID=A0A9P8N2D3_9HYPO|nr:uncharacterized protein HRG_03605 [Hirsutella rhossiliensis]KAH0965589.1 hypothetical protein HRG_03605 [Hirsutella rhossiliensis]